MSLAEIKRDGVQVMEMILFVTMNYTCIFLDAKEMKIDLAKHLTRCWLCKDDMTPRHLVEIPGSASVDPGFLVRTESEATCGLMGSLCDSFDCLEPVHANGKVVATRGRCWWSCGLLRHLVTCQCRSSCTVLSSGRTKQQEHEYHAKSFATAEIHRCGYADEVIERTMVNRPEFCVCRTT